MAPPKHVLPAQVVGVPVVLRRLLHRQFQQGEVPGPALGQIRVVLQHDFLTGGDLPCLLSVRPPQHLVDRVLPFKYSRRVDLLVEEGRSGLPGLVEVPDVGVAHLLRAGAPCLLQGFPPPRPEELVQVRTHADVHVLRDHGQGAVACHIEPPGVDDFLPDRHAPVCQLLNSLVLAAGVQDADAVRLLHGCHPAVHELFLVLCDCVHANFHIPSSIGKGQGQGCPRPFGSVVPLVSPADRGRWKRRPLPQNASH